MWMNYMVVAVDIGEFAEACRAQARVVEERSGKIGAESVDEDVLDRLVDAVVRVRRDDGGEAESIVTEVSSAAGPSSQNEGQGLLPHVLDLLERTILPRVSSQRIFRAYARLLTWQERWSDALKAYLDAYRCSAAGRVEKGSELSETKWRELVGEVEDIVDILRNFGPRTEAMTAHTSVKGQTDATPSVDTESAVSGVKWAAQARSIVRTFMARSRDDFSDDPSWERLVVLHEELRHESKKVGNGGPGGD